MLTIEAIWIYPVKGLRGIPVEAAEVEPWGLADDRRWMVVDPSGMFLTQRQVPRMALIAAQRVAGGLRLAAEGREPLEEPVPDDGAAPLDVRVWTDDVRARAGSLRASAWLSAALGVPCGLAYMADPESARPVDPDFAAPRDRVSFADGFPLLATTSASLADLNRKLTAPVGMDRFRPNIVVAGGEAWAEDHWRSISVSGLAFAAVKDCARCVVTTVDQQTGTKAEDAEPLRTLARFRRKAGGRIIFGQNIIPRGTGRIAVGDTVEVSP